MDFNLIFFMKTIFIIIASICAVSAFGQKGTTITDALKKFRWGTASKGISAYQLSEFRKAGIYIDKSSEDELTNSFRKLPKILCPTMMTDVDLSNIYFEESKRIQYMKELINSEKKLTKEEKKKFTSTLKSAQKDVHFAAGVFIIGQYAYLAKDYKRAAQAFKISKDIFTKADTEKIILARVEMAAVVAELQSRNEINLEQFILTDGMLFHDQLGEKNLVNLLMYLGQRNDNPCGRAVDPDGTTDLLIRTYNLYWQYTERVKIRFDLPFRTPYIENSLAETLTAQQTLPSFAQSGKGPTSNGSEDAKRQHLPMWTRAVKDPLINTMIFNQIIGANDLTESHRKDIDLLREYGEVFDFILSKHDLRYQLETSTATLEELTYEPAQPQKLQAELHHTIQKMPKGNIAKSYLYRHLATLFYTHNQLDSAAHYIRKTYNIQKKFIPALSKPRNQLVQGFFSYLEGDYAQARTLCKQALAAQKDDPTIAYTHHTLGLIYRAEGNTEAAAQHFEKAVTRIEQQTRELQRGYCREFFVQLTYDVYENLIALYQTQNRPEDVFSAVMKSKNNVFRQAVSQLTANAYTKDIQNINEYSTNKKADKDIVEFMGEFYATFWQSEKEHNQLRLLHQSDSEAVPLTLKRIKKYLANDEVLLTFYTADSHLNCLLTTSQNTQNIRLCTESQLEQNIKKYRTGFVNVCQKNEGKISSQAFFDAVQSMYRDVWQKIEQSGSITDKKLVIDSHGALHYFPFELIFSDNTVQEFSNYNYLIKKHLVRYVSDISTLMNQTKRTYKKEMLAFGNPVFKGTLKARKMEQNELGYYRKHLRSLPHTQEEIDSIATRFSPESCDAYTLEQATEDQLKIISRAGSLSDYRYIHFATHGLVNYRSPLLSTIALNQDDNPDEDGFLQFFEIDRDNIRLEAEMVVLSACETGLGKIIEGEGVVGFNKAFMDAGAQSLILSKWQVYDRTTADFFKDFYKNLTNNPDADKAQLLAELKRQRINQLPPFHWAGFVYYGN